MYTVQLQSMLRCFNLQVAASKSRLDASQVLCAALVIACLALSTWPALASIMSVVELHTIIDPRSCIFVAIVFSTCETVAECPVAILPHHQPVMAALHDITYVLS